jgi:hypothetical protein
LYGKNAKDLTADEKATVSAIAGLAGAATGVAVGGSMADVAQGNQAGHTAVDNNNLDILREEESKRELELATKYNWTSKQLTDYITNKSRGSIKGFADGAVESIEGIVNAVGHPEDTIKGIHGVISNPSAVYNAIELSVKEWEELYAYALQTNPGLAGQMEGYLSGKVGGSLTGGYLVTGTAAKVVSTLAKSKYATKIKEIAKGNKYLSKPQQGGTLNIGAGNKPIEGAYNISHPDHPMANGVHAGDANKLSNIATGSQNKIIMENPYKYDPLNSEILRVLSSNGTITIKGSLSNGTLKNLEKRASDKGLVLVNKTKVPNTGYTQTNGKPIGSSELIQYTFKKK